MKIKTHIRKFKPYTGILSSFMSFSGLSREAQDAAISSELESDNMYRVRVIITRMPCGALFGTVHNPSHYPPN